MTQTIRTHYYQQFDADMGLDVPAEGYGGWTSAYLPIELDRTALVIMHAWDCGTFEQFPGWFRAVEYLSRSQEILHTIFPELLKAVRQSKMQVFHVVGDGTYYKDYSGYKKVQSLKHKKLPIFPKVEESSIYNEVWQFRQKNIFPGLHNTTDTQNGFKKVDFSCYAKPVNDEGIAENGPQLFALCQHHQINHLIYVGFAINWCLLLSPGGMSEMSKYGLICSTIPEAVTAVETKETARLESAKQLAIWRVALAFGFIYKLPDFIKFLGYCEGFK